MVRLQEVVRDLLTHFSAFMVSKRLVYFYSSFIHLWFFGMVVDGGIVTGKDFEGEKEVYSNAEWKERIEKWKVRQEKRGLKTNDDGSNDQGDEDDYL